jgi:glycerol-3-phosphate acyltransferase PlsY
VGVLGFPLAVLGAFFLGAVPFSIIVGKVFLGVDVRDYGDGNPGAANVFRAGGRLTGYLAVFLDVAKGFPFVYAAHAVFGLPVTEVVLTGLAAILGHAFSPFLRGHGGKAIAVTFGAVLAMPDASVLVVFAACIVAGALLIEPDAWSISLGTAVALAYQFLNRGRSWETFLMTGILLIFLMKHRRDLRHRRPGLHGRLYRWVQGVARNP